MIEEAVKTIDQYIDAIKYHGHQYDKSTVEVLQEIRDELPNEDECYSWHDVIEQVGEEEKEWETKHDELQDNFDRFIDKIDEAESLDEVKEIIKKELGD